MIEQTKNIPNNEMKYAYVVSVIDSPISVIYQNADGISGSSFM